MLTARYAPHADLRVHRLQLGTARSPVINLLPAWCVPKHQSAGNRRMTLIQFPYTWKFLSVAVPGSPFVLKLGRPSRLDAAHTDCADGDHRLAWHALATRGTFLVVYAATAVAFLSATQDIAIDAYRRELLNERPNSRLGNAVHVNAYRIAGLVRVPRR